MRRAASLCALVALIGCGDETGISAGPPAAGSFNGGSGLDPAGPSGAFGGGTATSPGGSSASGGGSFGTGGSSGGGNPDPDFGFNRGGSGGGATGGAGGAYDKTCKNIDIVFSVDNSSSMKEEQTEMSNNIFPMFATKLQQVSPMLESFRVGVLDACPQPANFFTKNAMRSCDFFGGKPWIDSKSPKLVDEFKCVGAMDNMTPARTYGKMCTFNNDDEQAASTAAASLEPPASTGPNAGFVRKDAILVVVAMTDEDEQPTPNRTPQQVMDRLVAIKKDHAVAGADPAKLVVFLGIGGSRDCTGPYGTAKQARVLHQISDLFIAKQRGVFWDLCAGSLAEGLGRAMDIIKTACAEAPTIIIP